MPNQNSQRLVIHADKGSTRPGALERHCEAILADEFEVAVAADGSSAVVTHRRGTAQGHTLRVSANRNDYQAVRVYEAASNDGGVIGQMQGGAVVVNRKLVTELRVLKGLF